MQEEVTREDWADTCREAHRVTNSNMWREFNSTIVAKMNTIFSVKCWMEFVQSGT